MDCLDGLFGWNNTMEGGEWRLLREREREREEEIRRDRKRERKRERERERERERDLYAGLSKRALDWGKQRCMERISA
jgi:hypothetical protein